MSFSIVFESLTLIHSARSFSDFKPINLANSSLDSATKSHKSLKLFLLKVFGFQASIQLKKSLGVKTCSIPNLFLTMSDIITSSTS
jgi:hypothetical protein